MPVSPTTAYSLLRAFGMLEFELKRVSGFVQARRDHSAMVNWQAVDRAIDELTPSDFLDRVAQTTKAKFLAGQRNRPKVQLVIVHQGQRTTWFNWKTLPASDAMALAVGMRRVRNNLFHGGKEDPLEEPYPGDDDEWAVAAFDVADRLLQLVCAGQLAPHQHQT